MNHVGKRVLPFLLIAACLAVAGLAFLSFQGGDNDGRPPEPRVDPLAQQSGWLGPEAVAEAAPLVEAMPDFRIIQEMPGIVRDNSRKRVVLWEAMKQANGGRHLKNVRQEIGDCVSWGYRNAVAYLLAVAVVTGDASEFQDIYPPFIYGTSRVQVGGGRLSGDGSLGAWASKAVHEFGVLSVEADGVPRYSGSIAREWGRRGPPEKFLGIADEFTVETVSQITTPEDARDAICNGYPVPICSQFGSRTFYQKDGRWIARGDASWAHCMCLIGYDGSASEPYFYCLNSWGTDAHEPPMNGEPPGGFWITWQQADRILRGGDSFALSNFAGFKARDLDFHIIGKEENELDNRNNGRGDGSDRNAIARAGQAGADGATHGGRVFIDRGIAGASVDERFSCRFRDSGHDGSTACGTHLDLGGGGRRSETGSNSLFHFSELRSVRAIHPDGSIRAHEKGLADWDVSSCANPDCGCKQGAGCRGGILCDCSADLCCSQGWPGVCEAERSIVSSGCGGTLQRGDLFGPSQSQLRELADRAVDRAIDSSVKLIAGHKAEIASYGCAVAGTGGLVAAFVVVICRIFLAIVERTIARRKEEAN